MKFKLKKKRLSKKNDIKINNFNQKKIIKGFVIGIIIGVIISGGIGVAAVTLTSEQVTYNPDNTNFNVTNVKQALDEIYKIAKIGSVSSIVFSGDTVIPNSETGKSVTMESDCSLLIVTGYYNETQNSAITTIKPSDITLNGAVDALATIVNGVVVSNDSSTNASHVLKLFKNVKKNDVLWGRRRSSFGSKMAYTCLK